MKALRTLLVTAAVAAAFAAGDAAAQHSSHWSGTHTGTGTHTWSGTHNWSGSARIAGNWGGHRYYYPRYHGGVSFYFGVPLFWPTYYWGYPYYYDYPRTVVYREVERVPAYPEGEMAPAPEEMVPSDSPGAPTQGPLYMNYCESAKAYFPKVTSCPEGWRFIAPQR